MTLQEFEIAFDAMPTSVNPRCAVCGLIGRAGCEHVVDNFTPVVITGTSSVRGLLTLVPGVVEIPIDPFTGLYLK